MHQPPGRNRTSWLHVLHAILLAGIVPLFIGAFFSDIAYVKTYEVQWANFSSWLIVGAMVFCGLALLWALVNLVRDDRRDRRAWLYVALLFTTFVFGFIGALIHAKDAWATMPGGVIVSGIVTVLAVAAVWIGLSGTHEGAAT